MPWVKMLLRNDVVYARTKPDGSLASEGDGRVPIKYRLGENEKTYRAAARNLSPTSGEPELIPDETPGEAAPAAAPAVNGAKKPAKKSASPPVPAAAVPPDAIIIYTDGACHGNPGPMGLGAVVIDGRKRIEISEFLGHGTNNIAELTAIERALEAVPDGERARPIFVHSDSSYSLGLLTKPWKPKANLELVARLRALTKRFPKVHFVKVAGHAGVPENERCDELANEAVLSRATRREELPA